MIGAINGTTVNGIVINGGDGGDFLSGYFYPKLLFGNAAQQLLGVGAPYTLVFLVGIPGVSDIFYVGPDVQPFEVTPDPAPFIVPPGRLASR